MKIIKINRNRTDDELAEELAWQFIQEALDQLAFQEAILAAWVNRN
jgi:hypothetical protein